MTIEAIAELNDRFRRREDTSLGIYTTTIGVKALHLEKRYQLNKLVREFNCFTADKDPYKEHDFGKVTVDGEDYFWKIDYYDLDLKYFSSNPLDPNLTRRVMTIMHSSER